MCNRRLALLWFLLLPLLPACSLMPIQEQAPQGLPADTLQQARQQSAELHRLQELDAATPDQQRQIRQLHSRLQQFEHSAIRSASRLERQGDWHGAERVLQVAAEVLPDSQTLNSAQQQFSERRELREERVRMDMAIHRGERLLQDAEAYQRLRQLKGPGILTWLELQNFHRKCRSSAEELQDHAQQALQRGDYTLAQRGLKVARRLYGNDLLQDKEQRERIDQDLAQANRHLRRPPRHVSQTSPKADNKRGIEELQQALDAGDLQSARQQLSQLQQQAPQNPLLPPLQARFQSQLHTRVETAIRHGNELYSNGEIEQAVAVWRDAKALAPDNVELTTNITRAEKVLENLKALSTSPGGEL
ncbi:hypothetical protein [Microbulbifer sp. SAOS-129_SWC]|uniref:hypothetical protein n=1 Tax=Microbulbifer sp. SAOS-129_SWC TaxID=3145235 RepID=UPI003217A07D